jgi:hypothetical protein
MQIDDRGPSPEQLGREVKSIYAGLTILEAAAVSMVEHKTATSKHETFPCEVWRAMIGIHQQLLREHCDFFIASQHPSAPELHPIAQKYDMPTRLWEHSLYAPLELFRHHLPHSKAFMIQFIYHSHQMMGLFLETFPAFKSSWIKCLAELSRYRMAVEEDPGEREVWARAACSWYWQATDGMPIVERLCYSWAILTRPNALQMLSLCARSGICVTPYALRELLMRFLPMRFQLGQMKWAKAVFLVLMCYGVWQFSIMFAISKDHFQIRWPSDLSSEQTQPAERVDVLLPDQQMRGGDVASAKIVTRRRRRF